MLRQRKAAMRFSPLLLDENEEYEGDWVSSLVVPTAYSQALRPSSDGVGESLRGRLRLCSMSVVFDPLNFALMTMDSQWSVKGCGSLKASPVTLILLCL